jgi:TolB-like protein
MNAFTRLLYRALVPLCAALALSACTTTAPTVAGTPLDPTAKWALLPMANHTDTPQASMAAEAITEHLLRARGVSQLEHYPPSLSRDTLFEPSERKVIEEAQKWARERGARYGVTGMVEEWRYKVGIDGEPAVGVTLQVINLENGQVVYSASGARSGWSRESLSGVAHKLLGNLVSRVPTVVQK